jgi:hypothetical protein
MYIILKNQRCFFIMSVLFCGESMRAILCAYAIPCALVDHLS